MTRTPKTSPKKKPNDNRRSTAKRKSTTKARRPQQATKQSRAANATAADSGHKARAAGELPIYILSGGRGHTAREVINATLAQFAEPNVDIVLKPGVRRVRDVERIVTQAAAEHAVILHTLVEPKVREAANRQMTRLNVPNIDLLGPAITLVADRLQQPPHGQAGLLYEIGKERFDRVDAVDYTLAHDDGQRLADLDRADVVLLGVSRVSKSVTCFYLAARGLRAANVPLTPNCDVPPQVKDLDPERVIGLMMSPARLAAIRETRLERITHRNVNGYAEHRDVVLELRRAAALFQKHKWRTIDVSYKATEEVASEIVELLSSSA